MKKTKNKFNLKKLNIASLSKSYMTEIKGGTETFPKTSPKNPCSDTCNGWS